MTNRYEVSIKETQYTATATITCRTNGRTEKRTFRSRYGEAKRHAEEWAKQKVAIYEEQQNLGSTK